MSSFIPTKKHMREVLLFAFHLHKSAVKAHRMLIDANVLYREHLALNGFNDSKMVTLTSTTRNVENQRKNLMILNCKHYWMKTILKREENWQLL